MYTDTEHTDADGTFPEKVKKSSRQILPVGALVKILNLQKPTVYEGSKEHVRDKRPQYLRNPSDLFRFRIRTMTETESLQN